MRTIELMHKRGQAIWLDHAYQIPILAKDVQRWIASGVLDGLTSSVGLGPGRFAQSLLEECDLRLLSHAGVPDDQVLADLLVQGFREAADRFMPMFEQTNAIGGFVTLDIDPRTFGDPARIYDVALNLWGRINRPNLIVSMPATSETMDVLGDLLEQGVNVDASMICSVGQYIKVVECYLSALERRLKAGVGIEHIFSVASFSISAIDRFVNRRLGRFKGEGIESQRAGALVDQIGMAIARLAYAQFNVSFNDERFTELERNGARVQRLLWAGFRRDGARPPQAYLEQLIAPGTILALEMAALEHEIETESNPDESLEEGLSEARGKLQALESIGIALDDVFDELTAEIFVDRKQRYEQVLASVAEGMQQYEDELGDLLGAYRSLLNELDQDDVVSRIWQGDVSLWSDERRTAKLVSKSSGWLDLPLHITAIAEECQRFTFELQNDKTQTLIFLSSGSVAALIRSIGADNKHRDRRLQVIDSSSLDGLSIIVEVLDLSEVHFVYVSASANSRAVMGEVKNVQSVLAESGAFENKERFSLIAYPEILDALGKSSLEFRRKFPLQDDIPIHFAGLSYPGLIACAWSGISLEEIQDGMAQAMNRCLPAIPVERNPGLAFAIAMAAAARSLNGSITFAADDDCKPYLEWIKALFQDASLLSEGKIDISFAASSASPPREDGTALIVWLRNRDAIADRGEQLAAFGKPVKVLEFESGADGLGRMVALFLFTTAVMGAIWRANPFGYSN